MGWSTTTRADSFFAASDAPVQWDNMFSSSLGGGSAPIPICEVPELESAAKRVVEIAMGDQRFEQSISLLSRGEPGSQRRRDQIEFEYVRFIGDIIARSEAVGASSDDDLLAIYLLLEKARFAEELKGDLLVPIALTALDLDQSLKLADGLWIEPLDEDMQRARAASTLYSERISAFVIAAATHAIVQEDFKIHNRNLFNRRFRTPEIDLTQVDRVIQCLHIASQRDTGYAQAIMRPFDWADDWMHDLPAVWEIGQYHRYPDDFDNGGWNREKVLVPKAEIELVPRLFAGLSDAPPNVGLAARRMIRAVLRTDDEDKTLDATIGIEALMLGNRDRDELTHRMAQRAAAVLSSDGYKPAEIYRLIKKVYEHRSAIVHGRASKRSEIQVGEYSHPAQDVGAMLLRLLLVNRLLTGTPWTPESLDAQILNALTRAD
ncbi:hypothetical protein C1I92_02230 [Jiangella anatolica]|uniref:Uncharacterized protein n=1 Tax=Jiangella anatolica TaxID=2670374 RepID=A0A2W2BEK1_9ACTN|nr:hypothetical protein C1I92_02230 [Jiangella anatolica]